MPSPRKSVITAWKQASAQQAPLLAAGVAFYAFLSLFPAMIAGILTYGLVASPETVQKQSHDLTEALPADAASLVTGQLESLTSTPSDSLGLGLVLAIGLALYSASGGVGNMVRAINAMFGLADTRNFLKKKLIALNLTLGAIVFLVLVFGLVAATPAVLNALDVVPGTRLLLEAGRWVLLLVAVVLAIGVLFRIAPNRTPPGRLVSKGVLVAAAMWIVVSVTFSLYVDNFGSYGKTYGALAGVVVLLLWLWIGVYAILLGACIEAVREEVVTPDTVVEDREIAEWRAAEADGETVPVEVAYEPEPAPEPERKRARFRLPFLSRYRT